MDRKLTIVLPTFNRHQFVRRLITYYSEHPVNLIICDGSNNRLEIPSAGTHLNLNWIYYHIPGAKTLLQRIYLGLMAVQTEYFTFLDDGDLLLYSGIESAIGELTWGKDRWAAGGSVCLLNPIMKADSGRILRIYSNWMHWSLPFTLEECFTPNDRLLKILKEIRTANLYYLIFRTDIYRDAFLQVFSENISAVEPVELVISGIIAGTTSLALGNYPFWIRTTVPSVSHEEFGVKREKWDREGYGAELNKFADIMVTWINKISGSVIHRSEVLSYFEIHRTAHFGVPKVDLFGSLNPVEVWEQLLDRKITSLEHNDIQRADSLYGLFPRGERRYWYEKPI